MVEKWNHLRAELQRRRQGMRRRMRGFAYIAGFSRRRDWISPEMVRIKNAAKWPRRKGQGNMPRAKVQARQKPAEQLGSGRETADPLSTRPGRFVGRQFFR